MPGPTHAPHPAPPSAVNAPDSAARWLWTALALGAAAGALIVLVAAGWAPLLDLDRAVARWLHVRALERPAWVETNRVLTDWVWDPVTMRILVGAAALWVWLRRERLLAVWCVVTAAAGTGVQQGLKALLDRERPRWQHPVDSAHYAAMPSGHAMTAAVACALLVWLVQRTSASGPLRAAVLVLACLSVAGVSFTRIALGVHWLTDTVVGVLLGLAVAAAAVGLWNSRADGALGGRTRPPAEGCVAPPPSGPAGAGRFAPPLRPERGGAEPASAAGAADRPQGVRAWRRPYGWRA